MEFKSIVPEQAGFKSHPQKSAVILRDHAEIVAGQAGGLIVGPVTVCLRLCLTRDQDLQQAYK
jgi:hypothetical protein